MERRSSTRAERSSICIGHLELRSEVSLDWEVLGDVKPVGEENADEKLEIIPLSDVLMCGIVLDNGKLSAESGQKLKRTLFALRFRSAIEGRIE